MEYSSSRFHGVTASTLDSESSNPSSNLGGTCTFQRPRGGNNTDDPALNTNRRKPCALLKTVINDGPQCVHVYTPPGGDHSPGTLRGPT
ncbi:hypothetical protein M514_21721 [Trichuris suis]|uniref:Uncharacterized protein n=1 Tax=Trichuris suis TaxID=68888 RepID=A0A085N999_9BILA|nr:hypothetical protein M514_21721 [Trichuris suis]